MSSYGSYYGWVFPQSVSVRHTIAQLEAALTDCGFTRVRSREALLFKGTDGFTRRLQFLKKGASDTWTSKVAYSTWNKLQFRPLNLATYPQDFDLTLAEYELAKRVFDRTSSTECFGFHASQDNAVDFEDSNLDFFFLKDGPQLVLKHLDARRDLLPDEDWETNSRAGYAPYLSWDQKLHSEFFTRFSREYQHRIIRTYNNANELIEKPWRDYYRP